MGLANHLSFHVLFLLDIACGVTIAHYLHIISRQISPHIDRLLGKVILCVQPASLPYKYPKMPPQLDLNNARKDPEDTSPEMKAPSS